jgi:hypothetical protein
MNEAVAERMPPLAGDIPAAETFEALYERTFPKVYAYVASLLRDRSAAEDVTAQAFERAYRKRRSYRPARGTAEGWIFGIARNAALDELRRRKRRAGLHADPEDVAAPAVEDHTERSLRRQVVRSALAEPAGGVGPQRRRCRHFRATRRECFDPKSGSGVRDRARFPRVPGWRLRAGRRRPSHRTVGLAHARDPG